MLNNRDWGKRDWALYYKIYEASPASRHDHIGADYEARRFVNSLKPKLKY